jgi:hypothetical protein
MEFLCSLDKVMTITDIYNVDRNGMDKCESENSVPLFSTIGRKNCLDYFIRRDQMAAQIGVGYS